MADHRIRRTALAALLAALAPAPAPAAAQDVLATPSAPTTVSSHGAVRAWSERDPDTGAHHLVVVDVTRGGEPARVPVAPRAIPFDVDLGPGPGGGLVAAYSRCDREPATRRSSAPQHAHASGRGCDVYVYDFVTARERRLRGASTGQASEVLPSVWRDEVAFVRVYEQRAGARGVRPYLYVRRLDGAGGSRRQPGGARGVSGLPGPTALDLYGRRLGFAWQWERSGGGGQAELRLDTVDASHRVVRKTGWRDSVARFVSPQFGRGRLFAGFQRHVPASDGEGARSLGSRMLRHRVSTGALSVSGDVPPFLVAAVRDADRDVVVTATTPTPDRATTCEPHCRIARHRDVRFDTVDPGRRAEVTYVVRTRGTVRGDVEEFARIAADTLDDRRGWSLSGTVRWRRVASEGDLRLILASPEAVDRAAPGCSADYSCRVGDDVLINDRRWRRGAEPWPDDLARYRRYAINHEVGHWIGLRHVLCPGQGQPAPVMQQQSIALDGCEPNAWPLARERDRAADQLG